VVGAMAGANRNAADAAEGETQSPAARAPIDHPVLLFNSDRPAAGGAPQAMSKYIVDSAG